MFVCLQKTAGSFISFEPTKSIALHQVSDRVCRELATSIIVVIQQDGFSPQMCLLFPPGCVFIGYV